MGNSAGLAARNRVRIVTLILLSVFNYWLATCAAALATGLAIVAYLLDGADISGEAFKLFAGLFALVIALSVVVGSVLAVVRIPFLHRRLERRVLADLPVRIAPPEAPAQLPNLLEGLAIAGNIGVPNLMVVDDRAPNSFSVGTRPERTTVVVTTGLIDQLTRDELEAILAYEVSRIGNLDVALSSWTVALTAGAIEAVDDRDEGGLKSFLGWLPRFLAQRLQVWAVRGQAALRDRAAIDFTRHPVALVRALEKLHADQGQVLLVHRASAPLWIEVPAGVAGSTAAGANLARELALDGRIDELRRIANLPGRADGNAALPDPTAETG